LGIKIGVFHEIKTLIKSFFEVRSKLGTVAGNFLSGKREIEIEID